MWYALWYGVVLTVWGASASIFYGDFDQTRGRIHHSDTMELEQIQRFNQKRGVVLCTMFDPVALQDKVIEMGYEVVYHARLCDWRAKLYNKHALDDLKPCHFDP